MTRSSLTQNHALMLGTRAIDALYEKCGLEAEPGHFDLVWCTGVLYHMPEPLKLLHAIARTTDRIHIWTHYVDDQKLDAARASPIVATDER
jgi:alkanesulfonate monooxygenase SsuD/methylene tetrahydromethanopterin reductase-like flavin-dependent oxidoreductase (luciferase family)